MATPFERLEGKYEILTKIREGGMGSVYKVRHRLLDEIRVIKVMRPHLAEDEVLKARFLREAQVAIKLRHPNVAQIYDFTIDDSGYAYLVMEFIDGFNLQEVSKVLDRPPLGMVLEIAHQSLNALGYLHRKRMIHRDVSPDNLLVTRDEDGELLVKLIDLGIVKVHHEGDESLTSAGTFLGKVRYSSPEHFRTHEGAQVSEESDLYSFGVVLYELFTATYPIRGSSVASLISGHLMHEPIGFDASDPDGLVPEEIRAAVLKALEKLPENRHPSARHMRNALEPSRMKYPVEEQAIQNLFDVPNLTTRKIATVKPGSSQSRIDDTFRAATTPARGDTAVTEDDYESSGTINTGGVAAPTTDAAAATSGPQIRALLLGASKLVGNKHFDEARLQLASVLEIDPGNSDATELMQAVEAADVKTRQQREKAAGDVRTAVETEDFDRAESLLEKAIVSLGAAEIFDDARAEIDQARQQVEQRRQRVGEIEAEADALSKAKRFEEAIALVQEGLELEPSNPGLKTRLETAQQNLTAQIEAQRRQQAIDDSTAAVMQHLKDGQADEAERALAVAKKLYGGETIFADLATRLDELRHKQRLDRAAELREEARKKIEADEFPVAIAILEKAREVAPEVGETDDLLARANEGVRRQEEARRRQAVVDDAKAKIDRLVVVGRFESALQIVDSTAGEIGEFDEEKPLRKQLASEIQARDELEKRGRTILEQALEHAGNDAFGEANEALDEVRALSSQNPEIGEWVAEAETEIHRRLEVHRRKMAIDNVIGSVEGQIEKGEVDEARRELSVAKRLYGTSDVLDGLKSRIDARERELRREEIQTLIKQALRKKRDTEKVIADLETVLSIDPDNEEAQRILIDRRAASRRLQEDRLCEENRDALNEVDELIAAGDTTKAVKKLDKLISDKGEFRVARWLRRRLSGEDQRKA